jgi:DNA-directed RNA polymerase subunit beta
MSNRENFGKIEEVVVPPNLIELQLNSYVDFLQTDKPASKRTNVGLQAVFKEVFRSPATTKSARWTFTATRLPIRR